MTTIDNRKQEASEEQYDLKQSDTIMHEAVHALEAAEEGIMTNAQVRAEMFPFFSRPGMRCMFVCSAGYFACCLYGYDAGVMSGINVMPQYQNYFTLSAIGGGTGLIFSLYYAGAFVAAATGPFMADARGRKTPLYVGAFFALAGAIIQATSMSIEQFRAARFIVGYGSSLAFAFGPIYTVELAHPIWRGRLGGILMLAVLGCNTFSLWMDFLLSWAPVTSSVAWRFPLALQVVPPILLFFACWFSPESPRWLIQHGRPDEARAIIQKYHANGDPNAMILKLEMAEIQQSLILEDVGKKWYDIREFFNSRANLYRLFCILNYAVLVQWSGNSLGIYYLPVLVQSSGVTNVHMVLLVTCCTSTGALILAFVGTWLLEKIGRKACLLGALAGMAIFLAILAGLQSPGPGKISDPALHAGVAIIMLFRFVYALGMTPGEQVYTVEMLPNRLRARGWAVASLMATAALFASTYASPVALQNLGWKFYLVFIGLDVMWFFVILFIYPETHGRTLEEMEAIFHAKNPVKASREAQKRAAMAKKYGGAVH